MKPILYKAGETDFNHNGIGALSETIACEVTEERNGEFELYLEYPASGLHYAEIQELCLVKAKPNSVDDLHLFRIYERQLDTITQVLSVYATSISNDLGGNLVQSVVSNDVTPQTALDVMKNSLIQPTDFMFHSDINVTNSIDWKMRNPLNCIAGEEGSLLDVFGGEIKRGNDFIWLYARRGRDNVATIRHGKNLTGLEAEYSTKGLVTQILPYFTHTPEGSEAEETVIGSLVISQYANNYPVTMILPVDYSSDDRVTDLASLNTAASNYFIENAGIDKPSVAMDVDLDDLSDSSEYEQFKSFENVEVCDTITVYSKQFDVNLTAKVTQIVFDVLREKNQSLKVGSVRTSFYDDLKSGYKDLVKEVTVSLTNTIEKAANGKNRIFRGADEPLEGMSKNDVWYKPVGDGEIEMYVYDGAYWDKEAYSAGSLGGTVNFANINAINLNLNTLTTASITGLNMWLNLITGEMQFTNPVTGDLMVLKQGRLQYQVGDSIYYQYYDANGLTVKPSDSNTGDGLNTGMTLVGNKTYIDFLKMGSINDYDARIIFNETDLPNGLQIINLLGGLYFRAGSTIPMHVLDNLVSIMTGLETTTFQSDGFLKSTHIAAHTSSGVANVHVNNDGYLFVSGSASKYKSDIKPLENEVTYAKRILELHPKSWIDKGEQERGEISGRYYGLIADDLADVGLSEYTTTNKDGGLEGLQYDRLWSLLIPIVREQEIEIASLKQELADLKTLLTNKGVI